MMNMIRGTGGSKWVIAWSLACGLGLLAGCTEPGQRLNAPPQGATERPNKMQDQYVYMNDNAMLQEMSMSSVHFVPHRPELNALGMRRLSRYAELMKEYGGTLHYDGVKDPDALADGRKDCIRAYLVSSGLEPGSFNVERGISGGDTFRASEASTIRDFSSFSKEHQTYEDTIGNWDQKDNTQNR